MTGRHDPADPVERRAEVVAVTVRRRALVDRHPHEQRSVGRPDLARQRQLRVDRRLDRVDGRGEHGVDAVAGALEHRAGTRFDGTRQQLVVAGQCQLHCVRVGLPECGRVLEVGGEERIGGLARVADVLQLRSLLEDLGVQRPQRRGRLDAEFVDERRAGVVERPQCLGLAAGAVQRQHLLLAKPLVIRVLDGERLEFSDQLGVATEAQIGVDPPLQRGQPELVEPGDLGCDGRFVVEVGERRSPPRGERLREQRRRRGRVGAQQRCCPGHRLLEGLHVVVEVGRLHQIAAGRGPERKLLAERPPQVRHVHLEGLSGRCRRLLAPQLVDQTAGGDDVVQTGHQQCQHQPLLGPSQVDRRIGPRDGDRPEGAHRVPLLDSWIGHRCCLLHVRSIVRGGKGTVSSAGSPSVHGALTSS